MNQAMQAMADTYGEEGSDKTTGAIFNNLMEFVKMMKIPDKD